VVILTPSKRFFLLWTWSLTVTGPDVKASMVFEFKGNFMTFVGGESDH